MAAYLRVSSVGDLTEIVDGLLAAADSHKAKAPGQAARWRELADSLGDALDRLPAPRHLKGTDS
ncbi:hypothetical protein OOK29_25840 [Streptomyces phaeochromogenes]|uniref:hypothetical protein n=1 Tax=Streptomyces phaeochromogenes TaxID=1923 RepID=UPI0022579A54|nr:hypothetical protein [Streptomyces phaeochromogenes]MCX5601576.1 hypothetical protein [Streptomyces phaeochromogenes]